MLQWAYEDSELGAHAAVDDRNPESPNMSYITMILGHKAMLDLYQQQ